MMLARRPNLPTRGAVTTPTVSIEAAMAVPCSATAGAEMPRSSPMSAVAGPTL